MCGRSALDRDHIESWNYDRQTLEREGNLAVVVIGHLRNAPSKVAEEFEPSVIDRSQSERQLV